MTDETLTPAIADKGQACSNAPIAPADAAATVEETSEPPVESSPSEGPAAMPPRSDPAGKDALNDQVLRVREGVDRLLARFDEKLLHDEARTNEIQRLSAELAKHQPDAQWNNARPLVDQMIHHLDEIQRFARSFQGRAEATVEDFVQALKWLHEDIELALEEHDITTYRPQPGKDSFDGRRHTVVGEPLPTTDPSLSRVVERCVRPGFERHGKIVARAAVRIYRYDEGQPAH